MQSPPSMVTRSGDSLVVRSVVSGHALFVNNDEKDENNTAGGERHCQTITPNNVDLDETIEYSSLDDDDKNLPQCKVKRNYACSSCNYFTQNPRHYLYHLRDVHREKVKISECSECLYASRNFQKLVRHMKIVHSKNADSLMKTRYGDGIGRMNSDTFRRTRKRKHLKPSIVEALRRNSNDSVVSDEEQFPRRSSKNSAKKSAKAANFRCSMCPFTTKNQSHLSRHEKHDHIKTKFFRCVKCNYVTHIKARFTKHVKYHTMPMIKCDVCDFRTPYKWNLDRHYKNHNGRGAFRCGSCNFTADIKQSLTVHEMNHHTPPVGHHATGTTNNFVGVARRRNKVGASDIIAGNDNVDCSYRPEEQKEIKPLSNYYDNHSANAMAAIEQRDNYTVHQKRDVVEKTPESKVKLASITLKKKSRPIPNLIPIKPSAVKPTIRMTSEKYSSEQAILSPISQKELNDLCSRYTTNSSLRDFTSLFGDESDLQGINDKYTDVVEITPIKNIDERMITKKPQVFSSTPVQDDNDSIVTTALLSKSNPSFFDKLTEKLMTGAGSTDANNLTCKGCGHVSKCLSEMAGHQKLCGKFVELNSVPIQDHPSIAFSSTRCQLCRQRCKSSTDLFLHMKTCYKIGGTDDKSTKLIQENYVEIPPNDQEPTTSTHAPHPMENKVFVWNNIPSRESSSVQKIKDSTNLIGVDLSSSSSVRIDSPSITSENSLPSGEQQPPRNNSKPVTHGTDRDLASAAAWKKVFKCPHCSFWATTASRFHVHIVGHLNKKPFECSLCSYRSNWRWDITKHIRLKSVRDAAHERAKVLMTDETGRRNYSKYNKYLTQIQRDVNNDKTTITSLRQINSIDQMDISIDPYCDNSKNDFVIRLSESTQNNSNSISYQKISKKSAPALKTANMNYTNNNTENQFIEDDRRSRDNLSVNYKKTLWKCKRCNFRDNNKSVLLQHVKEHYRQEGIRHSNDETANSSLTTERHCRLKHQGDVRVVIGGTNGICEKLELEDQSNDCFIIAPNANEDEFDNQSFSNDFLNKSVTNFENDSSESNDASFKCSYCSFSAFHKQEFLKHLTLHELSDSEQQNEEFKDGLSQKRYTCVACPYDSNSKSQYLYHKQFHKPRGAPFKCNICSYNVTRRHLLHQHLKIHGVTPSLIKKDCEDTYISETVFNEDEVEDIDMSEINLTPENFLDIPLVWLQRNDRFCKVYQCRYCPFTNAQKLTVQDHEKMHFIENEMDFKCSECTYKCNSSTVFTSHIKYHTGEHGIIHCLVDPEKSDSEQISQLSQLCSKISSENGTEENTISIPVSKDLNENIESEMRAEKNIKNENNKILYFCDNCPARFLFRKEFDIHTKLHNSRHMFKCSYCTYTVRQNDYLLAHSKVHSEDYQNKTKILQSTYPTSSEHLPPNTTILTNVPNTNEPVWVVISSKDKYLQDSPKEESDLENQISASKVPKKRKNELEAKEYSHKLKIKSTNLHIKNNCIPISGTDLYNRKSEVQKQCSQSIKSTTYSNNYSTPLSLHVDPQFGILMHGNPEFIYPTYIKNGKTKEKRYKCHKCPSAFEKREQYKVHLSLHGSKQRYHCEHCDYSVKYYANYAQHVRKHQMNADAQAARRKSYEQSGNIENGESIGNAYSVEQDSGSSHYAIKSITSADNQGSLKLSIADKQSLMIIQQRRSNYIDSHKETSFEDKKTYWCPHCPYTNFRRDAIDNHIKRHVSVSGYNSNYTCIHCDYSVPQSHFLRDHIKLHFSPMKNNKLEAYMICNKLELLVKDVDENQTDGSDETEKNVFKDNGDGNEHKERFTPILDENGKESLTIETEDKIFVDPTSGETKINEDDKSLESNESHDQENNDLDKTKETPGNSIVIKKMKKECIKY